ncbi:MAG: ribonuclease III [Pseudomonadota bacterium]
MSDLDQLVDWAARATGHRMADAALLAEALTHPSIDKQRSYERLEFLGDRVLGLVIAQWLFEAYPDEPEGRLATRLAALVRRESLAAVARAIDLGGHLILAPSARGEGAGEKASVLADSCEALIGALYRDGGMAAARGFIQAAWDPLMAAGPGARKDAKTRLQEWAQGRGLALPVYREVARAGPDHAPEFTIGVAVEGLGETSATGRSKREAEQKAAKLMLHQVASLDG